jgi:alkylated DNA repair dioxygenase AlkB
MGWHSDDEPELGPDPSIASVSLGEPRRFVLRSRAEPRRRHECLLADGSLLLMEPPLQSVWQHALPKMRRAAGPRLNLTWRLIRPTGR